MALFLDAAEINAKLIKLIVEADKFLYLVSPYIKLHHRIADELKSKMSQKGLRVVVFFGKNPDDLSRSMKEECAEFFCGFPDVEIRYAEHLHAKFYASEDAALITSMNLYDYSQNQNIESGVLLLSPHNNAKANIFGTEVDAHAYQDAISTFERIIQRSELLFPEPKNAHAGFCIRTGVPIPFNLEKPMSYGAHQSWAQFGNWNYPEKFCHRSGKPSFGKTSMRNPVLAK